MIASEFPQSLAELVGDRLYALLPSRRGEPRAAAGLAERLRPYGLTGTSSHYGDPREIARAVAEAEMVLEALSEDSPAAQRARGRRRLGRVPAAVPRAGIGSGRGASLLRGHRRAPRHPRRAVPRPRDLLPTLESYLGNDCNMNATARAIYAHRHTVAYRLERVKELTGLDPAATEDRERLGLGLKALRIVEARS